MTSEEENDSKSSIIYIFGIIGWIILWGMLCYVNDSWNLNLFGNPPQSWALLFPFIIGIIVLTVNAVMSRHDSFAKYDDEVKIIEFVERNSSWFLIGSTAIFAMAVFSRDYTEMGLAIKPFIIYVSLYLLFLCFAIFLFWTPYDKNKSSKSAKKLRLLRHIKTVPFTYAVSFFTAAVVTLLLSVLQ